VQKPQGRVEHKPVDKLLALEAPYTRCLFLDTDTFALDDLSPIFALLDRFDLAALQDVNRGWNYQLPDVPVTFSEFNTGVLAFRRDAKLRELFQDWRTRYDALRQTYGFVNDQPAFRQALYHSTLRVAPLPNEFHFLGNFPNSTLWKVRLLHARGDYAKIGRDVNEVLGGRAYIPNVGVVPAYAGRRSWVKSTWQTFRRMAWLCLRAPADSAASNPRKWWLEERRPKS